MNKLIAYHKTTDKLALFKSGGKYWIGSFISRLTHQNGKPLYGFIEGYWSTEAEGQQRLSELRGDEF